MNPLPTDVGRGKVQYGRVGWSIFLAAMFLLVCSASLNILLGRKLQEVKNALELMRSEARLVPGAVVLPITARDLDGHQRTKLISSAWWVYRYRLITYESSCCNTHFPVYEVSAESALAYRLGGTPQTIVVSPYGQVVKIWDGAYEGDLKREFEVGLPGIVQGEVSRFR